VITGPNPLHQFLASHNSKELIHRDDTLARAIDDMASAKPLAMVLANGRPSISTLYAARTFSALQPAPFAAFSSTGIRGKNLDFPSCLTPIDVWRALAMRVWTASSPSPVTAKVSGTVIFFAISLIVRAAGVPLTPPASPTQLGRTFLQPA